MTINLFLSTELSLIIFRNERQSQARQKCFTRFVSAGLFRLIWLFFLFFLQKINNKFRMKNFLDNIT